MCGFEIWRGAEKAQPRPESNLSEPARNTVNRSWDLRGGHSPPPSSTGRSTRNPSIISRPESGQNFTSEWPETFKYLGNTSKVDKVVHLFDAFTLGYASDNLSKIQIYESINIICRENIVYFFRINNWKPPPEFHYMLKFDRLIHLFMFLLW